MNIPGDIYYKWWVFRDRVSRLGLEKAYYALRKRMGK